jgi:hypothetical protein
MPVCFAPGGWQSLQDAGLRWRADEEKVTTMKGFANFT